MPVATLNIAGIPLKLGHGASFLRADQRRGFLSSSGSSRIWKLDSLPLPESGNHYYSRILAAKIQKLKKRLRRFKGLPSHYLQGPVIIDTRRKQIRYFNTTGDNFFSGQLPAFAYSQLLALSQGLLLHGAGIVRNNGAYLFLAVSGGGKSTVARISRRYRALSDDIVAVRKIKGKFLAFATPWKQGACACLKSRDSAPVKAVFFLKKSRKASFRPLRPEKALSRILSTQLHFLFYTERPLVDKLFVTCADLMRSIPAYEMEFRKDKDFWPELTRKLYER